MTVIPLVTLAEIKTYIDMEDGITDYDATLTALSKTATQQIEDYTRRKFLKEERTEYFATKDNNRSVLDLYGDANVEGYTVEVIPNKIRLKASPIDEAEDFLVYYDTSRSFPASSLIPSTAYALMPDTGAVFLEFATVRNPKALKVVYTGGYAASGSPSTMSGSAPEALKLACIYQTLYLFDKLTSGSVGTQKQTGDAGVEYKTISAAFSDEVLQLINPYKIIGLGG